MDCNWGFSFEAAFFAPFLLNDLLDFLLSAMDLPLSVGDNGASSSKRPRFDLNLPIASEPEPASTSDPKEGVDPLPRPLSIEEEHILDRSRLASGTSSPKLLDEVRAIARLKAKGRSPIGWKLSQHFSHLSVSDLCPPHLKFASSFSFIGDFYTENPSR